VNTVKIDLKNTLFLLTRYMAYNLVIVESASKSKTIQKYLNQSDIAKNLGEFKVVASLGHIIDLPQKTLGVNTDTWILDYTPIEQKKKVIQQLKGLVKDAKMVYLAADPDREGEAIAWHLKNHLKPKKYKRITFHEITPRAIEEALLNPRDLDIHLIAAQESRRALDRIVGYKVSPLLWKRFATSSLSAGRVQSVALGEIVQRFKDYQSHEPDPFWTIESDFELFETPMNTSLYDSKSKKKVEFTEDESVKKLLTALIQPTEWQLVFEKKKSKTNPSAPYTTSALQQEAYEKYKIPAKQTMSYAQQLYEKGFITYMRTDSVNLSDGAKQEIHTYLQDAFGDNYVTERSFKSKVANAQEAHECIRPSNFDVTVQHLDETDFTPGHRKIYDLIWRKSVASQMPSAEYVNYHFKMTNNLDDFKGYDFRGKVTFVEVLGYLEIWQPLQKIESVEIDKWDHLSSQLNLPIQFIKANGEADVTRPHCLYNEPSLIKWMEKEGIGRPSTYSTILDKLFSKGYITKGSQPSSIIPVNNYLIENKSKHLITREDTIKLGGNEKDRFIPTSIGERVVDYLIHILPSLLDRTFTSQMEENLDKISRNDDTKTNIMDLFYKDFEHSLNDAQKEHQQHVKESQSSNTETNTNTKKELKPSDSNILKSFNKADIVKTRYGPAILIAETKKFISITPFIEWKEIEIEDVSEQDIQFLINFPKVYQDINIEMGRYGLYLVYEKKNYYLPKDEWDNVYINKIDYLTLKKYLVERPPSTYVKTKISVNTKTKSTSSTKKTSVAPKKKRVSKKTLSS